MKNKFLNTGQSGYHPLRKFYTIMKGLRYAALFDFSVMYKAVLSVIVLLLALSFHQWIDAALVITVTGFTLMSELFNTAIEAMCDFIEEKHNDKIAIIKDIAAAAAGIAVFVWGLVLGATMINVWNKLAV